MHRLSGPASLSFAPSLSQACDKEKLLALRDTLWGPSGPGSGVGSPTSQN